MPVVAPVPRFLADEMLGRLARWLRVLGYDTAWSQGVGDDALLERAEREGRVLLTRDTLLVERRPVRRGLVAVAFVRHDHLRDQLAQLGRELGLHRVAGPRCLVCNSEIVPVTREFAASRVPPYVAATQSAFRFCAACDRVVWPGTHWDDMVRVLRQAGIPEVERPESVEGEEGWPWAPRREGRAE